MCGLVGIFSFNGSITESLEHQVRQMCDTQNHRGPDDSGVTTLDNVCFGSNRLSIIDLSPAGHMPMSDDSGQWWIAYNGEVYNFKELREELLALGHTFRSQTDTEVVLHAFMEWGDKCLTRLVGMFAFAIFERKANAVHLVRDRYGIKPLYYVEGEGEIIFASEAKTLTGIVDHLNIDKQSLIEWSLYRNVDILTPKTLLDDVYSVLPGEIATITNGRVSRNRFYNPIDHVRESEYKRYGGSSPESVVKDVEATLDEAVKVRLVSDVPVGTLCSGGLDSSLITAIAAAHSRDLTVFNVAIDGYQEFDESIFARRVAEHFGLKFVSYPLTGEVFRSELPKVIYQSDFPLTHPNSVAYHLICRVARQHGVTVLLSGEGADELFGGYDRYRKYRTLLRLQKILQRLPHATRQKLSALGLSFIGLQRTSLHARDLLPFTVRLVDGFARQDWLTKCELAYSYVEDPVDRALLGGILADLSDFLTPLLRRLDRTSMANSVECRVPFLDHRLVHKAINLPLKYRVGRKSGKWVVRQVARDYLPVEIWKRRKTGFPLPLKDYLEPLVNMDIFRNGFCQEQFGLDQSGLKMIVDDFDVNVQGFFSYLCLEIWGRLFIRQERFENISGLLDEAANSGRSAKVRAVS